jgi:hypothetical protein
MPLSNRVTPLGAVIATPGRGLVFGNRGCLHDRQQQIRRDHVGRRWIACRLEFRGWRRAPLMAPGRYTELFFLDEATALAAGHRPCALCRHDDYHRLTDRWTQLHPGQRGADAIDVRLHGERLDAAGQRHHRAPWPRLPDGAFVLVQDTPWVILGDALLAWTPAGYRRRRARPHGGRATVITPPSLLALLAGGWGLAVPLLHPTAAQD